MNLCLKKGSFKNNITSILFFIITFFAVSGILCSSSGAGEVTETLKGTLDKIIKALNDPELKT